VTEHVLESRCQNLYLSFIPRHLRIKKIVRDIKPDLIHAHFIAKYGFHLPGLRFHPSIVSAWGDDVLILPVRSRLIRWHTGNVLRSVDLIYAVSENIGNRIIADFGIPANKLRHMPFGIDTDMFFPGPEKSVQSRDTIEIFSNRGFFPVYDTETLVKGFAAAYKENPKLRLTLKGDGPEEQKIRNVVRSLGMSSIVTFKEKTVYSDVPDDYRNADVFITTSLSDGTPVSVLEAMASGLPCIATGVGGIPEWIEDEKSGLLIAPGNPDLVASSIQRLASNPDLIRTFGTAARETIVKRGQWKTLMAQAEKDYEALIETYKQDKT
jgi:glycosyltransferase involved in cell wall biosynthesis